MSLKFFDANCYMGRNAVGSYKPTLTGDEHIGAMEEAGIDKALLWHIAQLDGSPAAGNALLAGETEGHDRLYGCWTVLPSQTRELAEQEVLFRSMKEHGIFALRAFPSKHRFLLNRLVFGKLLDDISERKIPLLLSMQKGIDNWQVVYDLMKDFPSLACILCDTGDWGVDRYFRPLLENYGNLYMETSFLSMNDGVIEDVVGAYGSERLVYGSGFPERYPLSSMMQLKHAGISEEHKENIAFRNMERLLLEVVL